MKIRTKVILSIVVVLLLFVGANYIIQHHIVLPGFSVINMSYCVSGIAGLVLAIPILILLNKILISPILSLTHQIHLIRDSKDLSMRLSINRSDEIGSLAESLNQMVTNLQETMTSRDNLVFEINQRRKAEADKEKDIDDLERALKEIKTLEGFLPICSSCKKIRDDKGDWKQIESYIHSHSKAEFSHGICPDCAKKLYSDLSIDDSD